MHARQTGAPARGALAFGVMLVLLAAVSVTAYVVGRQTRTPAQIAAHARPPAPSLITAPIQLTKPRAAFVFRATVVDDRREAVGYPDPSTGLAVVSTLEAAVGSSISEGALLGSVSGQPVFVFSGAVPAYQTMSLGSSGVEVAELQAGLQAIGISTGEDTSGHYGPGTAAAVNRFYVHYGLAPNTELVAGSSPHRHPESSATVPLGEVTFVPTLPATVMHITTLGQKLATGKPFATLGSGTLSLTTTINENTASLLRIGLVGRATSEQSDSSIAVRVIKIGTPRPAANPAAGPQVAVTFAPLNRAAATGLVGQNLAVHVSTGKTHLEWVVPVAALVTNADGHSSVTVLAHGKQRLVPVRAGSALQGSQVIYPKRGTLHPGEEVVVGVTAQ